MNLHMSGTVGLVVVVTVLAACSGDGTTRPPPVDEIRIELVPNDVLVTIGQTAQLAATVTGGAAGTPRTVTFRSSNPQIATVDQTGLVRGVAAGQTQVTAIADADTTKKDASNVFVGTVDVPGVTIKSVTVGNTNTPVTISNVFGQIDITASVTAAQGVSISRVEWLIDTRTVCQQTVTGPLPLVAAGVVESDAQVDLLCSANTAAFNATTGAPSFSNGVHQIAVRLIGAQGQVLATAPPTPFSQLTFNNANLLLLTLTPQRTAPNQAGLTWFGGTLLARALPVLYSGGQLSSVTFTVNDAAAGGSSVGPVSRTVSVTAAGSVEFSFPTIGTANLAGFEDASTTVAATSILAGQQGPSANTTVRLDNKAPAITGTLTLPTPNRWIGPRVTIASLTSAITSTDGGVARESKAVQWKPAGAPATAFVVVDSVATLNETTTNTSIDLRGLVCDALANCVATATEVNAGVDKTPPTNVAYTAASPAHMTVLGPAVATFTLTGADGLSGPLDFFGTLERLNPNGTTTCVDGVVSGTACDPISSSGNAFTTTSNDGYFTFDAAFRDHALNTTLAPPRTVVRDFTPPGVSNIGLPGTLPSGGQATFTATATDNLDLRDQLHITVFQGGDELPYSEFTPIPNAAFGAPLLQSSSITATVAFIRSIELTTPANAPAGTTATATAARFVVRDWGTNSSQASNNFAGGTVPPGTSASALGVNQHNGQVAGGSPAVICDPQGPSAPCGSTPTSTQLVGIARGQSGTFAAPYSRIVLYRVDATGDYHFIGESTARVSADNGNAGDPLGRTWTYGPVQLSAQGLGSTTVNLSAVGVDAQGDALISAAFSVTVN